MRTACTTILEPLPVSIIRGMPRDCSEIRRMLRVLSLFWDNRRLVCYSRICFTSVLLCRIGEIPRDCSEISRRERTPRFVPAPLMLISLGGCMVRGGGPGYIWLVSATLLDVLISKI